MPARGRVKLRGYLDPPGLREWCTVWAAEGEKVEPDTEREEAQHVIDKAASGGYFENFAGRQNRSETHRELELAAEDLLAGQFPNHRARVKAYPESEHVDIIVERIRKR
jgi:hypothetical protein